MSTFDTSGRCSGWRVSCSDMSNESGLDRFDPNCEMLTSVFMHLLCRSFTLEAIDGCGVCWTRSIMTIIPLVFIFRTRAEPGWVSIFWMRVTSCCVYIRSASDALRQRRSASMRKMAWKWDKCVEYGVSHGYCMLQSWRKGGGSKMDMAAKSQRRERESSYPLQSQERLVCIAAISDSHLRAPGFASRFPFV